MRQDAERQRKRRQHQDFFAAELSSDNGHGIAAQSAQPRQLTPARASNRRRPRSDQKYFLMESTARNDGGVKQKKSADGEMTRPRR